MMSPKFSTLAVFFTLFAAVAQALPSPDPLPTPTPASDYQRRLEERQLDSIVSVVTSGAASIFSEATGAVGSAFAQVTSLAPGVVQGVTSVGGKAVTVITSLGGEALTLADEGKGVVTSKFGSVFSNVATAVDGAEGAVQTLLPGVVEKVTSVGGKAFTVITSIGGEALTLADEGKGVVTSKFGTVFTNVATAVAEPTSTKSGAVRALAVGPLAFGVATVLVSTMLGAAIAL